MKETAMDEPLRDHDMYGHTIVPVGDGFGVSVTLGIQSDGTMVADLVVFHASDGFRQSLLACMVGDAPYISNIFPDRLAGVLRLLKEQR